MPDSSRHDAWRAWVRRYGLIVTVYLLATGFTKADFMGDTIDYVASIVAMAEGHYYYFWEFAHLLWRPLGWAAFWLLTPLTRRFVGDNPYANVTLQLLTISWLAGLLAVFLTHAVVRRLVKCEWIANVITIAFMFSYAFLNHAQSGASYVPGLSLLLLGLATLATSRDEPEKWFRSGLRAGAALAGAVCLWVPYVLAVPAALASPLLLFGMGRHRLRLVLVAALACALFVAAAYGTVLAHLGISDLGKLRAWMAVSAEGAYLPRGGLPRMAFSLPRSFVSMGNDGPLFKRYLSHDSLNPVSVSDLLRPSLLKLAVFYALVAAVVLELVLTWEGRRFLAVLALSMGPVMALALLLEGGAADRYLPLYPFMFLGLAYTLSRRRLGGLATVITLGFVAVVIVTNSSVLATPVIDGQQQEAVARMAPLQSRLKPGSLVLTVNLRDELVNFNRSFPLNAMNRDTDHPLRVGSVVVPGSAQVGTWRQGLASTVLKAWRSGGDVWMSTRVLSPRPQAEWGWVESDDPRVSWADVHDFFSRLDMGESLGGPDGFALVVRSPRNEEVFRMLGEEQAQSRRGEGK
jgi:hypothetical protein